MPLQLKQAVPREQKQPFRGPRMTTPLRTGTPSYPLAGMLYCILGLLPCSEADIAVTGTLVP